MTGGLALISSLVAVALAWQLRWIQDDAFIVFHYARAWASGHGPTWFGDYVDGYANPIWVAIIAIGFAADVDPIDLSHAIGVSSLAATLAISVHLYRNTFRLESTALLALILVVSNYSLLAYATGGLETMPATLWATGLISWLSSNGAYSSERTAALRHRALSAYLAFGVLIRYDLMVMSVFAMLTSLMRSRRQGRIDSGVLWALIVPFVCILTIFFVGRWSYYGFALPNLFHAKAATGSIENGVAYLIRFFNAYSWWPLAVLGSWAMIQSIRSEAKSLLPCSTLAPTLTVTTSWLLYVVIVGGDFMEFRMMVPAIPGLALVLASGVAELAARFKRGVTRFLINLAAIVLVVSSSFNHAKTFRTMSDDKTLDSIPALSTFYGLYRDGDWSIVGAALAHEIGDHDVVLATSACGAIPYYSRIPTIDMCGLNDRQTALHGLRASDSYRRPGHQLSATRDYLRSRAVNLILGHPHVVPRGLLQSQLDLQYWYEVVAQMSGFDTTYIGHAHLVAMPIDATTSLVMWYLQPHPAIESKLATGAWEQRSIWPGF